MVFKKRRAVAQIKRHSKSSKNTQISGSASDEPFCVHGVSVDVTSEESESESEEGVHTEMDMEMDWEQEPLSESEEVELDWEQEMTK